MTNRNIGILVNHREIDHLLTSMSDTLRNAAYKVAEQIAPKGSTKYDEYFDEDGTLRGYDVDTNKALLRDCLDHYVQYATDSGNLERTDFNYYLEDSFQMVASHCNSDPQIMSYLTGLFARACGILASVLQPVLDDIQVSGQIVDKIESHTISFENTFYLVYGEDVDNPETYDPKEDDLTAVDCSQTPEELEAIKRRSDIRAILDTYVRPYSCNSVNEMAALCEKRITNTQVDFTPSVKVLTHPDPYTLNLEITNNYPLPPMN